MKYGLVCMALGGGSLALVPNSATALNLSHDKTSSANLLPTTEEPSFVQWGSTYHSVEKVVTSTGSIEHTFWEDNRSVQNYMEEACQKVFDQQCSLGEADYCDTATFRWFTDANGTDNWHCLPQSGLNVNEEGQCMDNCGNQIACTGNWNGTAPSRNDMWIVDTLIRKLAKTCPTKISVDADPLDVSNLQSLLDDRCSAVFKEKCKDVAVFCNNSAVARQENLGNGRVQWLCLGANNVNHSVVSSCVDNCGAEAPCTGGIVPRVSTKATDLIETIEAYKAYTCRS